MNKNEDKFKRKKRFGGGVGKFKYIEGRTKQLKISHINSRDIYFHFWLSTQSKRENKSKKALILIAEKFSYLSQESTRKIEF